MHQYYHSSDKNAITKVKANGDLLKFMQETEGLRLARLRKTAKLTQQKLADKAGCSVGTIGNIESGLRGYGESVVAISRALEVTPEYLQMITNEITETASTLGYSTEALALAWLLDQVADRLDKKQAEVEASAVILRYINGIYAKPTHTQVERLIQPIPCE